MYTPRVKAYSATQSLLTLIQEMLTEYLARHRAGKCKDHRYLLPRSTNNQINYETR